MIATATAVRRVRRTVVLAGLALVSREAKAQFLSVSGSPATMKVQAATAGLAPSPVSDASTSYTILEFGSGHHKIVAQMNATMPAGLTLTVTLQAPSGASSMGPVMLDTSARDVVTGISTALTSRSISYDLSATLAAGVVPLQSRTVTYTIVAAP